MTTRNDAALALVIVAAGSSTRFGGKKKEYLPMGDGTVLSEAARAFLDCVALDILAVAYPTSGDAEKCRAALLSDPSVKKSVRGNGTKLIFAEGGKTRQDSVLNALEKIGGIWKNESKKIVLIHDGARPFVSRSIIEETVRAAAEFGAAVPGIEPTDTQKEIDGAGFIKKHLVRSNLRAVQTPQGFSFPEILEAHRKAGEGRSWGRGEPKNHIQVGLFGGKSKKSGKKFDGRFS